MKRKWITSPSWTAANGPRAAAQDAPVCTQRVGAMATTFFHPGPVRTFEDAAASDTDRYAAFFRHMLERGVYLAPSQYEAMFVSTAHGADAVERTVSAAAEFFSR